MRQRVILFQRDGEYKMAFCRGPKKGCKRNLKRQSKRGPCPDCVVAEDENETLETFLERMQRGDA